MVLTLSKLSYMWADDGLKSSFLYTRLRGIHFVGIHMYWIDGSSVISASIRRLVVDTGYCRL